MSQAHSLAHGLCAPLGAQGGWILRMAKKIGTRYEVRG